MFMRKLTMKRKRKSFNNCKKSSKETNQRWLVFKTAIKSCVGALTFLSKFLKNICERGNVTGYKSAALLTKELLLRYFSRILPWIQLENLKSSFFVENHFIQNTSSGFFCLYQQIPKNQKKSI